MGGEGGVKGGGLCAVPKRVDVSCQEPKRGDLWKAMAVSVGWMYGD